MDWHKIAETARSRALDAIPQAWRLPVEALPTKLDANVIDVPRTCGLLSTRQLEITELTATELLSRIAEGQVSSVEATEAFCIRSAIAHQLTNCLTSFFPTAALEVAKALDAHYSRTGETIGPLHGLPIAIKDQYNVKGELSTLGYMINHDNFATEDAAIVHTIRKCGAVIFGKTTMPQTGMAIETTSPLWGTTKNPYNAHLVSGGSSGGDGALVAMKGCPVCPSSDIGGSIRVPAAFNGLYSIRPSGDRISKTGLIATLGGQISIKTSCGPVCHSLADVKLLAGIVNAWPQMQFEPGVVPMPWRELSPPTRKLSFGLLDFDGVCMPHPPILRALKETAAKLTAAGHEVVPINLPFDCWKVALTTWGIYFQTGAVELKARLAAGGEEMIPSLAYHLKAFHIKPLSAGEAFALNREMLEYKTQMSSYWNSSPGSSRPFDGVLAPVHPSASYPHNFPSWWGYTSLWNILDYPSLTLPIKNFKISPELDAKDLDYRPLNNPFDQQTYEIYDPQTFASQPVCIQLVGRPFQDEEITAVAEVVDTITNG